MYASTPSQPGVAAMCPVRSNGRIGTPMSPDLRGALLKSDSRRYSVTADETEAEAESASSFFLNHISEPIVQAKCVNCHVEGGVSGHTRLILHPASNAGHAALNLAVFQNFLADVEDGGSLILNKIQGVGHGGGIQVPTGSDDFANMETFLSLLGYGGDSGSGLSPDTLFDTVTMASPGKTLWRAALIFGGTIPTREEREAVENGTEEDLRTAIRNRMTGPGFHEFLIRASNDRLLTDRHLGENVIWYLDHRFVDLVNLHWTKAMEARERGFYDRWYDAEYKRWWESLQYGIARAPLELIAHVVEKDLPYTEVLTADYIMANPMASEAYGASTEFKDVNDWLEFAPSEIVSYYRDDDSKVFESDPEIGSRVRRSREPDYRLPSRRDSQHDRVPAALPHDPYEPQPRPFALDVLPLSGCGYREVGFANDGSRRSRRYQQPHDEQFRMHGVPHRHGSGCRRVSELRGRWANTETKGEVWTRWTNSTRDHRMAGTRPIERATVGIATCVNPASTD